MQQDLRNNTHAYRGWLGEQWQLLSANEGALLKQATPEWPSSLLCVMTSLLRCCDSEVGCSAGFCQLVPTSASSCWLVPML